MKPTPNSSGLDTSWADAANALQEAVDKAVIRARDSGMTIEEIVKELGRLTTEWELDR